MPDPILQQPTDAIAMITSSGLCGSDLYLYETLNPFMGDGDIMGHKPMGIVQEAGSETGDLKVGDRVVVADGRIKSRLQALAAKLRPGRLTSRTT